MSLFIGGTFLLLTDNLTRVVQGWRSEAKIVVYLRPDLEIERQTEIERLLTTPAWSTEVRLVSAEEATSRFQEIFPSVAELLEGLRREAIPPSFEIGFDPQQAGDAGFRAWLERLRQDPGILMVDDDRDWLRQLEAVVAVLRGLGLVLGGVLLGAATFTIASVVRLTAHLYREEIAVMRLVGATELYIRGPFYVEGLLQGLAGGLVALAALYGGFLTLDPGGTTSFLGTVLVSDFLRPPHLAALLGLGSAAGLFGAVVSLRREVL